jgi:hypothetical protein
MQFVKAIVAVKQNAIEIRHVVEEVDILLDVVGRELELEVEVEVPFELVCDACDCVVELKDPVEEEEVITDDDVIVTAVEGEVALGASKLGECTESMVVGTANVAVVTGIKLIDIQ